MDYGIVAQQIVEFVKPYLIVAAGKVVEGSLEGARVKAGELWSWLKTKLTRPAAAGAVVEAEQEPANEETLKGLMAQIERALRENEAFREELLARWPKELPAPGVQIRQTISNTGSGNKSVQNTGQGSDIRIR